jgi:dolichol-phosphate mannosyltransferase
MRLSVILPVYSERESVVSIVDWLAKNLDQLHEVIIVLSPKSDNDSKAVCEGLAKRDYVKLVIQKNNPGVGLAYREGFSEASGTHILMLDSDGEMELEAIPRMLKVVEETDCDVVVGSRWLKGGGIEGYDPLKYWYNLVFQNVFRFFYRTSIHDLTFGLKIMKADVVRKIRWESRFNEIGAETTLKPIKHGCRVCEVPAKWIKRVAGKSKNNFMNNFRYLRTALKILFLG